MMLAFLLAAVVGGWAQTAVTAEIPRTGRMTRLRARSIRSTFLGKDLARPSPSAPVFCRGGARVEDEELVLFPPLTEKEIMEKLNTIPVFGIADKNGNAVVVKTADGEQVNWCFLQQELAHALMRAFTEQHRKEGGVLVSAPAVDGDTAVPELFVRDIPLGMIWKAISNPDDAENSDDVITGNEKKQSVELRLLADRADLEVARNMTMSMASQAAAAFSSNGAAGALEASEPAEASILERVPAAKRATFDRKLARLNRAWGVVPVFTMANMKIRTRRNTARNTDSKSGDKDDASDSAGDDSVELRPWFLSITDCVESWKKASGLDGDAADGESASDSAAAKAGEQASSASLHMATLEELVDAMRSESPVDFRKVKVPRIVLL
jgi:hypothetical protein